MRRPMQEHCLLEEELQGLLASMGSGGDENGGSDEVKKRVRTIKNRLAAKRSREQARSRVDELERGYSLLMARNEALARRLAQVEMENTALRRGLASSPHSFTSSPKSPGKAQDEGFNNTKHRVGDSAVVPTPPQLGAVLLFLSFLSVAPPPPPPLPSTSAPAAHPREALLRRPSPSRRLPVRRACRALRRAGLLWCLPHSSPSIPRRRPARAAL
jgi:hypothetical protein